MKIKYLLICILSAMLLAACTREDTQDAGGFKIYRTNANLDTLVWENVDNEDDEQYWLTRVGGQYYFVHF